MSIPAHKNVTNPPGQIVNPVENYTGVITPAKTLRDQIDRHTSQDEKKLTFEEWWACTASYFPSVTLVDAELIWTHAQNNV